MQIYTKNPEKVKARNNKWRKDNPQTQIRWRKDNPDYGRHWYKKNPEKSLAKAKRWRQNNPHKVRMQSKLRQARKRAVYHEPYTEEEFLAQLIEQDYLDFYTDEPLFNGTIEPDITEDHIIPISRNGPDVLGNIVFIKRSTNSSKGARTVNVFLAELVRDGRITQEDADRKLAYLRERFGRSNNLLQL